MEKTEQNNYLQGAFLIFIATFLFALKGVLIKTAYHYGADTITILTLRMLASAPFYVAVLIWENRKKSVEKAALPPYTWLRILGLGFIGYYLSAYLNFYGLNFITASLERVTLFVYPTFVLLINLIFFKKPISKLQFGALAITYLGILIAFLQNLSEGHQVNISWGVFLVIASGFTYAFYMVGSDRLIPVMGIWRFTSWSMLAATLMMLVHAYCVNGLKIWHLRAEIYYIGLVMAFLSTVIPTFLYSAGIKRVGSSNTSIISSTGPIFTIILATIFLGESISFMQILGTILVLVGVFLIGFKGKK
jgi:drug/metabolite transporter (DMT)-like permease